MDNITSHEFEVFLQNYELKIKQKLLTCEYSILQYLFD